MVCARGLRMMQKPQSSITVIRKNDCAIITGDPVRIFIYGLARKSCLSSLSYMISVNVARNLGYIYLTVAVLQHENFCWLQGGR